MLSADEYYTCIPNQNRTDQIGQIFWTSPLYLFGEPWPYLLRSSYNQATRNYDYRVSPMQQTGEFDIPQEPNRTLQLRSDERAVIIAAKRRPVILVSKPVTLWSDSGRNQYESFLVAPMYSLRNYSHSFIERIKGYVYEQFFYLPSSSNNRIIESFVCLDRIQAIHKDLLEHWWEMLSDDAQALLQFWIRVYLGEDLGSVDDTLFPYQAIDEYPIMEMQLSVGLWPDRQTHYESQISIAPELEQAIAESTYAKVLMRNWYAGSDQFFFTRNGLNNTDDFRGITAPSYLLSSSNWLNGMGGEAQFIAFVEVYTALERGIVNAAVASASAGYDQRWYEVTDYINGPLPSFLAFPSAINNNVWDNLPRDIQQILIEEGAKYELETLRMASIENLTGLQNNIDAGMEFVEFSPEIWQQGFLVVRENVIPGWLQRLDYPRNNHYSVDLFNEKIGPLVGLRIQPDGTVTTIPITAGPHAGKTMEQVLSE